MDATSPSRNAVLRRLVVLAVPTILAVPPLAAGCGAKVAVDGDADGGVLGNGGAGGASASTGGDPGAGGLHPDGGCTLTSTGVGGDQTQVTECFAVPASGCPNQYDAVLHIVPSKPCVYLVSVDCGPVGNTDKCCYVVTEEFKPCGT